MFLFEGSAEDFVIQYDHGFMIDDLELIDFKTVSNEIYRFVLNGMLNSDKFPNAHSFEYFKKELLENINEYYGLASTSEGEKSMFHPLIKGPIFRLKMNGCTEKNGFFFLVSIESYVIFTCFRRKV